MLKSKGLEAFPDFVLRLRVFISACECPQMNTLKFNTQTGVVPVPWTALGPSRF
jgi:hypothetical protein